jgi:hypothetical protein
VQRLDHRRAHRHRCAALPDALTIRPGVAVDPRAVAFFDVDNTMVMGASI